MKIIHFLGFVFLFCVSFLNAQTAEPNREIDSLLLVLKSLKHDTSKVNTLNVLSRKYINTGNYQQAIKYGQQGKDEASALDYSKGIAAAYNNLGIANWYKGDFETALNYYFNSQAILEKIGDKKGIANSFNNIGIIYESQGKYLDALSSQLKALKIREEIKDKNGIAASFNNIGNIYKKQNNDQLALENYQKGLALNEEMGNLIGKLGALNNIGTIYRNKNNPLALENYLKCLKISEEIQDKRGIIGASGNIGLIYSDLGNNEKALESYRKCLKISEEIGDKRGIGLANVNIGIIYTKQNKFEDAFSYLTKSLLIAQEIGSKDDIKECYAALSDFHLQKGNYKQAFQYHKLYSEIKDTLLNEQSSKQIAEMNVKYDSEKKDKDLIKKDAEISQQQIETEKKNFQRNAFIIGFILVLMLAFYIFRGYRQKQIANNSLEEKNSLIENQKQLVEDKNKKITDSISYAKRIQQAILPSEELIKSSLPNSFVFFKPKDIVSGDFYWLHALNEHEILIAAADCTGHGVPGALMSMMGYNLLEQVVKEHHIYEPAIILNELSRLIIESLKQTDQPDAVKDGMDIALCKIDFQKRELEYAGAHNPLYLIRNGILTETKANNRSVGISTSKATHFLNHKIKLEQGDCLYIFTDGYVDQKGGPKNEKFFYQPFRNLLTEIHQRDFQDQQNRLEEALSGWIGNKEQIDDILVIGIKC